MAPPGGRQGEVLPTACRRRRARCPPAPSAERRARPRLGGHHRLQELREGAEGRESGGAQRAARDPAPRSFPRRCWRGGPGFPQLDLGVIEVKTLQPVHPHAQFNLLDEACRARLGGVVEAARPEVLSVDAQPEAIVAVAGVDHQSDLVQGTSHRAAGTRRILNENGTVGYALRRRIGFGQGTFQSDRDLAHHVVESGAEVRADVQDQPRGPDAARHREVVSKAQHGLVVELAVGGGQIDQVRGVTERIGDRGERRRRLAVGGENLGRVLGGFPHPRALGEDLYRGRAHRHAQLQGGDACRPRVRARQRSLQ